MGEGSRGAMTASQVSAGRKNHLSIEIYGTKSSVRWDQERPDELWIGQRNSPNQVIIKDPSLLKKAVAGYADLPGGHSEATTIRSSKSSGGFAARFPSPNLRQSTRKCRMAYDK
jgi:predicted dehydrogenase